MGSRLVGLLGHWDRGGPVAASLADHVRSLILDGRLTVGEKLPSERALAAELHRSRATITAVYDRLSESGYVQRVHGSGTHIALPHRTSASDPIAAPGVDFTIASTGSPPGLHEATMQAMSRMAQLRCTTGYTLDGIAELRDLIAMRYRERGVPTTADQIIVTSGAMHALALALAVFAKPGRTALVEEPTFPNAISALRRDRVRIISSPVRAAGAGDEGGWDLRHLCGALLDHRPHLAYLVPDFHNPTAATMTDNDRAVVAATAKATGTTVIVDETCAELDIDRGFTPLPFAAHGDVISLGSMSKLAWGGLRVGWIRASPTQVAQLLAARPSLDLGTAPLEQCIAVELLQDVTSLRTHLRARLLAGRAAVASSLHLLPSSTMPTVPGGLAAWLDLGEPVSSQLSVAAADLGLRVPPGPRFSAGNVLERYLRIPIALLPDQISDGMHRLGAAWEAVHAEPARRREPALVAVV